MPPSQMAGPCFLAVRCGKRKSRPKAAYFGRCSSPLSQPVSLSVFKDSSRLHSKHRYVRCPLSRTGNVAPQTRQAGRAICPMVVVCRLTGASVHSNENAAGRMSFQSFLMRVSWGCHKSRLAKSRRRLASMVCAVLPPQMPPSQLAGPCFGGCNSSLLPYPFSTDRRLFRPLFVCVLQDECLSG